MNISIIYEDDSLLVIDKPPGIVVNKAQSVKGETIQDWAERHLGNPDVHRGGVAASDADSSEVEEFKERAESDFYNRAGIVHRLDKDTSGLLLIAKTPKAFYYLQSQFKERKVTKKYQALVHGLVKPSEGEIKASVGRLPWNRQRFGILPGGRQAITIYKVIFLYKEDGKFYSLLEVTPLTGRTHQIRVHLKYIGHPIVADRLYAGRKTYREDMKFFPRIFLHASYLKFQHPESLYPSYSGLSFDRLRIPSEIEGQPAGAAKQIRWVYTDGHSAELSRSPHSSKRSIKWIEFASPLPNDLQVTLDRLEKIL